MLQMAFAELQRHSDMTHLQRAPAIDFRPGNTLDHGQRKWVSLWQVLSPCGMVIRMQPTGRVPTRVQAQGMWSNRVQVALGGPKL